MATLEILKLEKKWWNQGGEVGGDINLKLGLWSPKPQNPYNKDYKIKNYFIIK